VVGGALVTLVFCTSGSAQVTAGSGGEAFLGAYGIGFASAGFSCNQNPLEAQAFAVEAAYVDA